MVPAAVGTEVPWIQDIDSGLQQARTDNKHVMLVFTGRGWCGHCIVLEREVFRQPEFLKSVGDQYVFVELDFTFGDSPEEKVREDRLRGLAEDWLVSSYPTVVLLSEDASPYAHFVGYDTGSGVRRYLDRISSARKAQRRLADLADDAARPAVFAGALARVAEHFDTDDGRDDALLKHYAEPINRVLKEVPVGDANRQVISRRQEAQIARDRRQAAWRPIADRLSQLSAAEDWRGVIAYINETLPTLSDPLLSDRLQHRALRTYEEIEDYENALAVVRRLRSGTTQEDQQQRLLVSEARLLFLLQRPGEAIALFDLQIEQARHLGLADRVQGLMDWKLQLLMRNRRFEEAIATSEACRRATRHGSEDWLTATYIQSLALRQTGRFQEALRVSHEQFEADPSPYAMADLAVCCFGIRKSEAAEAWLAKVEAEVQRLRESPRPGDWSSAKDLAKRVESIRKQRDDAVSAVEH